MNKHTQPQCDAAVFCNKLSITNNLFLGFYTDYLLQFSRKHFKRVNVRRNRFFKTLTVGRHEGTSRESNPLKTFARGDLSEGPCSTNSSQQQTNIIVREQVPSVCLFNSKQFIIRLTHCRDQPLVLRTN